MKTSVALATLMALLAGCVGNKAQTEVVGLKIDRKPSVAEEANGWVDAINKLRDKQ